MTCKNCHHLDKKSNPAMLAQGFARCHVSPKWEFHAATWTCAKWKAKQ